MAFKSWIDAYIINTIALKIYSFIENVSLIDADVLKQVVRGSQSN
jgi:hypothetical protein